MSATVEDLAASLVREFLSRKGLKQTLTVMDKELPRTAGSVCNRSMLARAIHIERLIKNNKDSINPYKTMIEVVIAHLLERPVSSQCSPVTAASATHNTSSLKMMADTSLPSTPLTGLESERLRSMSLGESGSHSKRRGMESRRHGFKPRTIAEWESDQKQIQGIAEKHEVVMGKDERSMNGLQSGLGNHSTAASNISSIHSTTATTNPGKKAMAGVGDIMCEDLEDCDFSMGEQGMGVPEPGIGTKKKKSKSITGTPISTETAKMLQELLFGSSRHSSFNMEWRRQNFTFCKLPGLEYGLVQHKGGTCGVLACVQAYIIKHLLFRDSHSTFECLQPSPEERNEALILALSDILWMLGRQHERAIIALPLISTRCQSQSYTTNHLTEKVLLYNLTDQLTLREFISSHLNYFQQSGESGCIYFLLSAILSKGIESIRNDMDDRQSSLIGTHSYCTQEMINLLLSGSAVSNVFDGNITLDSGSAEEKSVLKGIPQKSEIGFLTLFEHYGNCIVGSHYKEPVYPIWVVCSESHFTVLFSLQRNLLSKRQLQQKFDLLYYDGLANQDEPIRLTIDNTRSTEFEEKKQQETNSELIPPLQLCIQTKWKTASVDWNGSEPLL